MDLTSVDKLGFPGGIKAPQLREVAETR